MNLSQVHKEVYFISMRSRGPGGQNVNKVASAVQLVWSFRESIALTDSEKALIARRLKNRINRDDQLYLRSDEYRDLERNKARSLEKLDEILVQALHRPPPRKATRPTRASKVKKRESKTLRSRIKKARQKVSRWD